ncbi:MAG TPA: cupin domain-containing protein [Candidatus Sulfotelmatobacter sp.]|nr:cupin domain-containing protein [Candidatus Sulfotelmatobacter sp.]
MRIFTAIDMGCERRLEGEIILQKQEPGSSNLECAARRVNVADSISRKHRRSLITLALIAASSLSSATAQQNSNSTQQAATPAVAPKVLNIWTGVAPGSEQWKQKESTLGSGPMQRIVNVTTPTLTAYLPDPAKATGTAVIIAPGGGFIFLGTDTHEVAEWLAARGLAAFVLKYRTVQLEGENEAQLNQSGGARFGAQLNNHALIAEDGKYGIADGIQAIKVVRAHATEWGLAKDRIVFMGFSAGGSIAEFASVQPDMSARPNYAAPIYGAPFPVPTIPKEVPPFFMEMAQDDTLAGPQIVAFYDALKAAGHKPEFLIYTSGGHGWGMRKQGKSSDHWIDDFYFWLESQGLTRPQSQAQTGDAIFPKGELSTTKNHTGNIWLKELNVGDSTFDPSIALATYDPGAKLDWHIHPGGQVLLITEGAGYYQERGKPTQIVHKGDVIKCLPGVEHWHGATPESGFAYLAVTPTQKGKTIWLEPVSDKDYNSLR